MKVNQNDIPNCLHCNVKLCPISNFCSDRWKKKVNSKKTVVFFKKGRLIIKEDTEAFGIYINHSGKVFITSEREDEKRQIIRIAEEGDILEYIQNGDSLRSPFSVEALEDCICCYIPKYLVIQMFRDDMQIMCHIEKRYATKLIEIEKQFKYFMIMTVRARIATVLLDVSKVFNGNIPLLRKELGEMVGVSAEQVSREVMKLTTEGLIKVKDKTKEVIIIDEEGLKEILTQYEPNHKVN